jgi:hypothetical protein
MQSSFLGSIGKLITTVTNRARIEHPRAHIPVYMEAERIGKRSVDKARPAIYNLFDDRIKLPLYLCSQKDEMISSTHTKKLSCNTKK